MFKFSRCFFRFRDRFSRLDRRWLKISTPYAVDRRLLVRPVKKEEEEIKNFARHAFKSVVQESRKKSIDTSIRRVGRKRKKNWPWIDTFCIPPGLTPVEAGWRCLLRGEVGRVIDDTSRSNGTRIVSKLSFSFFPLLQLFVSLNGVQSISKWFYVLSKEIGKVRIIYEISYFGEWTDQSTIINLAPPPPLSIFEDGSRS